MSWKSKAEPVLARFPVIKPPAGHVSVRDKAKWTAVVLLLYAVLTNIELIGLGAGSGGGVIEQYRTILAGQQGTLLQVGIAPIVTASIVMQLLQGANLIGIDPNDPRDKIISQGLQNVLIVVVSIMTAVPLAFTGGYIVPDTELASTLGISLLGVETLLFLQIALGGIIILYMNEIVNKWGVGSGVGVFIIAGVSQRFIGGIFAFPQIGGTSGLVYQYWQIINGSVEMGSVFTAEGLQSWIFGPGSVLAIASTVAIIYTVVYVQSSRVEIPLSHAQSKMGGGKYPINLIYASVLPLILVRAIQINLQFIGQSLYNQFGEAMPAFIGVYSGGQPVGGLLYYLSPINRPQDWMWWLGTTSNEVWQIMLRVFTDMFLMVIGGAIFAVFWVRTTDMGPQSVADQIQLSNMQIKGFRQNTRSYEKVLERYIPQVTVIGGAFVGLLAVLANMLGTIGQVDGIGLLLTISILYKIYEELGEEYVRENISKYAQFF